MQRWRRSLSGHDDADPGAEPAAKRRVDHSDTADGSGGWVFVVGNQAAQIRWRRRRSVAPKMGRTWWPEAVGFKGGGGAEPRHRELR